MCGIVGIVNAEKTAQAPLGHLFTSLLLFDQIRGWDSTGVFIAKDDGEQVIYKRGLDASTFIGTDGYENLIQAELSTAFTAIGHNRSATKGSICDRNAHPFTWPDNRVSPGVFTAVHNGNIGNANALLPGRESVEVDSMIVPRLLHERGEVAALEAFRGAFALVWFNQADGTVNLARNNERPLAYCHLEGKDVLVFASEYEMLWMAINRLHLKMKDNVKLCQPGTLYKFKVTEPQVPQLIPFQLALSTPAVSTTRQAGGHGTSKTTTATDATAGSGAGLAGDSYSGMSPTALREIKNYLDVADKVVPATRRRECWAYGKKEVKKAWARCFQLNVHLGSNFMASFPGYTAYGPNQKNGKILCNGFGAGAGHTLELPNCTFEQYKELRDHGACMVRVVNARLRDVGDIALIVALHPADKIQLGWLPKSDEVEIDDIGPFVGGPDGKLISVKDYLLATGTGCGLCGMPLSTKDAPHLVWVKDSPICKGCAEEPALMASIGESSTGSLN